MTSGPIIIDPQELRKFVDQLQRFNDELNTSSARLQSQFRQLGDTWLDPAYAKFAQEFEQTMKNLYLFRLTADEVIPRLLQTADRADDVHR